MLPAYAGRGGAAARPVVGSRRRTISSSRQVVLEVRVVGVLEVRRGPRGGGSVQDALAVTLLLWLALGT